MREQIDTLVQLPHALGNLNRGVRVAEVPRSERAGVEELLKATVRKSTEEARADLLASQPAQDLKFRFSVNEMFDLGAVDAEK